MTSRPQRPVRRALRVKTVETLPRPMSAETYVALLGVLRTRRDRALLELMWEGGLRPGEVLGLRLEDISYGRRRIVIRYRTDHPAGVRQKSRRERTVDLLEGRALPAVSDYVMHERPTDAATSYVFLVGGKGKRRWEPLSYDGLVRMFARAAARAKVREAWLTPHALRHTHATRMFERVRAQAQLRHHAERADEPARLSREAIADLVESLGDIVVALAEADPVDKAEVYRQLGLQLTYHPDTQTAYAEVHLGVRRWEMVRVRGGT